MRLETERLILRPFEKADIPAIAAINADAAVMRFFDAVRDRKETESNITFYRKTLSDHGFGFLAAELEATGECVGIIGISRFDDVTRDAIPRRPEVEVGWRLARDHWGKDLAPEGARACLAYAWDVLKLPEVVAITTVSNTPSRRVMEKIGMVYDPDGDFVHPRVDPSNPLRHHVLYRIENPRRL